jgi:TolA-binding protein
MMQKANVFLRQGLLPEADQTLTRARASGAAGPFIPAILSRQATLRQKQMNDYAGAIELLEELCTDHPNDARAPGALLQIGINETGASRYAEAITAFQEVEARYATVPNMASQARFLSGTVFELQGNWDDAEQVFRSVTADFPRTSSGLLAPLQIAAHYERAGNDALYQSTLRSAAEEYNRIARDLAGHDRSAPIVLSALDHLADVYTRLGDWDQAVEILLTRAEEYPADRRSPFAYVQAAAIQEQQLGNLDGAVSILVRMTEKYPNLPLSLRAKEKIELMRDPS